MSPEQFIAFFLSRGPFMVLKVFFIALLLIHVLFSLLLIRQTKMMLRVVEAKISPLIYGISIVHALFSVFVLLWTALFL